MPRIRSLVTLVVAGLLLAACGGSGESDAPSPTPSPSATMTPSATEAPTAAPTPELTASPTDEPTPDASPTGMAEVPGGFPVHRNAEADSLFLTRDTCSNERDHYELSFPDAWYTNTEIGRVPACIWFSPTDYDVPDPTVVPDEIAITIEWVESASGWLDAPVWLEELTVGGQAAQRAEFEGAGPAGQLHAEDYRAYLYRIELGPPGEGPSLWVMTTNEMGGDYELNKAVMDRMMATIEFFGSVD